MAKFVVQQTSEPTIFVGMMMITNEEQEFSSQDRCTIEI